jgi:hypothetical protein
MKTKLYVTQSPLQTAAGSPALDIVVPFTNRSLTRAALTAAGRLSAGLHPLIRMVRTQIVPFPLQLESAPVSTAVLRQQFVPLAEEFGAHLQICFTRDQREGLLHTLAKDSVVVIAARRHWWKSREERLANWLRRNGRNVVLEFVEKKYA